MFLKLVKNVSSTQFQVHVKILYEDANDGLDELLEKKAFSRKGLIKYHRLILKNEKFHNEKMVRLHCSYTIRFRMKSKDPSTKLILKDIMKYMIK